MPKAWWILPMLAVGAWPLAAQSVAYIYGDVAANGTIPSGAAAAYDQMLLTDTGDTGLSEFKAMVEAEGYAMSQFYDQATTLNATFLNNHQVIVFGLHQKVWSQAEKDALDAWIRRGGGILTYSDSAAGGRFSIVGVNNTVGQTAVNNLISQYGMEVTVDQAKGVRSYRPDAGSLHPILWDQPIFEGEGVSPVGVHTSSDAEVLIPFANSNKVAGSSFTLNTENVTDAGNRTWAVIAQAKVGQGHVIAIFDRQPLWNNGPGSDINEEDNREVLRRIIRYLALDYGNAPGWPFPQGEVKLNPGDGKTYLELSYDQWTGGNGTVGVNYSARNLGFRVEFRPSLDSGNWTSGSSIAEPVGIAVDNGDETETVTVRVLPAELSAQPSAFARVGIYDAAEGSP